MSRVPPYAMPSSLAIAQEIANSEAVLGVYAASEWDELHDDGKLWISAIVAEARRRFGSATLAPAITSNVRPAPFSFTPGTVAGVLHGTAGVAAPRMVAVPFVPTKLVDQPRPPEPVRNVGAPTDLSAANEPARVAPQQAAEPTPVETPCSAGVDEAPAPSKAKRLAVIREAAASLAAKGRAAPPARASLGERAERKKAPLPPLRAEQRLRRTTDAIAFLSRLGVLVAVVDRDALVRKYSVTGKREHYLADDVVAYAIERGFEPSHD